MKKAKKFNYKGKLYTLKELSELFDINYSTLSGRLQKGMSIKQAIEMPLYYKQKAAKYKYKGKLYSVTELKQFTNLTRDAIVKRIKKGMNIEDVLTIPKHSKKKQTKCCFKDNLNLDEMIKNGLNRPSKYDVDNTWIKEILKCE